VIQDQYRSGGEAPQESSRGGRQRQCLLKGCEQWYCPARPQSRYCSEACRREARGWRRWQSSRRWRGSERGRSSRRRQGQRYRQRRQQRADVVAAPTRIDAGPSGPVVAPSAAQRTSTFPGREGQRPARIPENYHGHACHRPGCYELFPLRPRSPGQRFCCAQCRRALRRVLDREAKWRRRRPQRGGPCRARGRPPPEPR
jgi:hypothetical protein